MKRTRKNKRKSKKKTRKVYDKEDFSSGDGMLTSVWGPSLWHYLHTMSFNYPVNPTGKQKKAYKSFIYREIDKIMKHHFTNLFLRYYLIWIGSKGSKTGIHKDNDEQNLLLQIYGKKKVIIFKTEDNTLFRPREIKEGDALLSSLDYWKDRIDIPKKEIILEPGDLLYIPKKYWHCAENLSNSIAISCRSESITKFIKVIF